MTGDRSSIRRRGAVREFGGSSPHPNREGLPMPSTHGSVSLLITDLKAGHAGAFQPLWNRYYEQLVRRARRELVSRGHARGESDEEDVALSTFHALHRGVKDGRFPDLDDREDLWRVLVHIAADKIVDKRRHETRGKRDVRRDVPQSPTPDDERSRLVDEVIGREPSPELSVAVADELVLRTRALDDVQRRVVEMKLKNHTNDEIAADLDCSLRTVVSKLGIIRKLWLRETTDGPPESSG
jgi:DNA-directed RNA polymerase specialized sigma24 family protein